MNRPYDLVERRGGPDGIEKLRVDSGEWRAGLRESARAQFERFVLLAVLNGLEAEIADRR